MANNVVATGRMELIDLHDNRQLQLFISSSQPKTQIYNSDDGSYAPNWQTNKPTLSPQLYIAGNSTDIIQNAKSIKWYEDGSTTEIVSGTEYTLSTGNKTLTINQNVLVNVNTKLFTVEVIHTDAFTGYDVLIKSSIGFSKVLSGKKGDVGSSGSNAVIAVLNNDYHGIPTDSSGNNGDYSGANTTITIFEGGIDSTSSWTITATPSTGVTGTLSGRKYSVTGMTSDEGYVDIRGTKSGFTTVTKRFVFSKSKSGETGSKGSTGSSATAYWLVSDAQVIVRDEKNEYTPSAVTFTAKSKTGNNSPIDYAGRWQIADSMDGAEYVTRYISSSNESSKSYSPRPNIYSIRVRLYLANGTTLIDEQIISVANYGNKGYEGQDASHAIVWTPKGNTILNGEGEVVAQADLYKGSQIVEAKNYRWVRENPNETSVVAGAGWEDLYYGKENLYNHSGSPYNGSYAYNPKKIVEDGKECLAYTGENNILAINSLGFSLEVGQEYTFSFDAKASRELELSSVYMNPDNNKFIEKEKIYTNWKRYSFSFTVEKSGEAVRVHMYPVIRNSDGTYETFYLADWKLERGNKATPWSPSFKDGNTYSQELEKGSKSWIMESYQNSRIGDTYLVDYTILKESSLIESSIVLDSPTLKTSKVGDITYLRTAVYSDKDKEFNFMISQSNTIMIYINGISSFSQEPWLDEGVPIQLKSGWNTIELAWVETGRGDILNIIPSLFSQVDDMNCYYSLRFGQARGIDGIKGFNTNQLTVTGEAVVNIETFKCFIDDGEYIYSDTCIVNDVTEPYNIVVFGTSVFKNGQGESKFTAKIYQNGEEVDSNDDSGYTYKWYIYDSNDVLQNTWNTVGYKTGKTITVHADDILNEARLVCEVDA